MSSTPAVGGAKRPRTEGDAIAPAIAPAKAPRTAQAPTPSTTAVMQSVSVVDEEVVWKVVFAADRKGFTDAVKMLDSEVNAAGSSAVSVALEITDGSPVGGAASIAGVSINVMQDTAAVLIRHVTAAVHMASPGPHRVHVRLRDLLGVMQSFKPGVDFVEMWQPQGEARVRLCSQSPTGIGLRTLDTVEGEAPTAGGDDGDVFTFAVSHHLRVCSTHFLDHLHLPTGPASAGNVLHLSLNCPPGRDAFLDVSSAVVKLNSLQAPAPTDEVWGAIRLVDAQVTEAGQGPSATFEEALTEGTDPQVPSGIGTAVSLVPLSISDLQTTRPVVSVILSARDFLKALPPGQMVTLHMSATHVCILYQSDDTTCFVLPHCMVEEGV